VASARDMIDVAKVNFTSVMTVTRRIAEK